MTRRATGRRVVASEMPDKTWDVLGDLPSDASATSSDEDDDGDRGDGSRGGSRGADLAAPEPRRVREVTYEDLVRRSYGGVVAAMDEDARRRRGEEAEASAAAKDDEGEGTRGKRRDEREGDSEDSDSDAKRPQLVQNAFGNWLTIYSVWVASRGRSTKGVHPAAPPLEDQSPRDQILY